MCVYAGTGLGASRRGSGLGVVRVWARARVLACGSRILFLRFCVFGFQFLFFVLVSSYQFQIFRFEFLVFQNCFLYLVFSFYSLFLVFSFEIKTKNSAWSLGELTFGKKKMKKGKKTERMSFFFLKKKKRTKTHTHTHTHAPTDAHTPADAHVDGSFFFCIFSVLVFTF